jgi:hypothetical protein
VARNFACIPRQRGRGSGRSRGRVRSRSATYCASRPAASGRAKIARPCTAWSGYGSCRGCHASISETSWTPRPTRGDGRRPTRSPRRPGHGQVAEPARAPSMRTGATIRC